ncbi:hypothetical protein [Gordonia sp. N1V]|uniref:hypothetical protein n=1 Tax=Gordonia sp. N1V TaxID=3034163 RepID=UPI0023E25D25|nr:hypothetical protein [Gordonia sp. N1V]MDF3280921.1 hypothetical protein [Gordonia sp. N1V]
MTTSPVIRAALLAKAVEAQNYWRSLPPAQPTGADGHGRQPDGSYRASIQVRVMSTPTRMKVRVYSIDPKAHWIEYGAKHMPKYAPMAKTRAHVLGLGGAHALGSISE